MVIALEDLCVLFMKIYVYFGIYVVNSVIYFYDLLIFVHVRPVIKGIKYEVRNSSEIFIETDMMADKADK